MATSIAIANDKGGVGKTTLTAGLAAALRERDHYVSLIDLDPLGALTLLATDVERLRPEDLPLALRRLSASDYILVDTPPGLRSHINAAMAACDGVLVPTTAHLLSLRGLSNLLASVDSEKLLGLVLVAFRGHTRHQQKIRAKIEQMGSVLVIIPFTISISDAALIDKDVLTYGPCKRAGVSEAFRQLAKVVETWQTR